MSADDLKIVVDAQTAEAVNALANVSKRLDDMVQKAQEGGKKTGEAVSSMSSKIVDGLEGATRSVLKWTAAIGALATGGGIALLVKNAIELQTAMADVGTILGAGSPKVSEFTHEIEELSKTSVKSAEDLSRGLYQAISAGVPATMGAGGAMEFLAVAQKAATAGMATTKDAVTVGALAMNTFGVKAGTAVEVFNSLQTVVARGVTRFPELAQSLGNVATIAANSGVKFKDMLAAITVATKGGLDASKATDALRAMIQAIAAPTEEARRMFKALHQEYGQGAIEQKGLSGIISEIIEKTGGNAQALRKLIPDVQGLTAAQILGKNASKDFRDEIDAQARSMGAVDAAAKLQSVTVAAAAARLRNAANAQASGLIQGEANGLTNAIGELTTKVNKLDMKSFADGLAGIVTTVGWIADQFVQIIAKIGTTSEWLQEGQRPGGVYALEEGAGSMEGALEVGPDGQMRKRGFKRATSVGGLIDMDRAGRTAAQAAAIRAAEEYRGVSSTDQGMVSAEDDLTGGASGFDRDTGRNSSYNPNAYADAKSRAAGEKARKLAESIGRGGRKAASDAEKRREAGTRAEEDVYAAEQELSKRRVALYKDEAERLTGFRAVRELAALAEMQTEEDAEKSHARKATELRLEQLRKLGGTSKAQADEKEALRLKLLSIDAEYAKQRLDISKKLNDELTKDEEKALQHRLKLYDEGQARFTVALALAKHMAGGSPSAGEDFTQAAAGAFEQGGIGGVASLGMGLLEHSGLYDIQAGISRIAGSRGGGAGMGAADILVGAAQLAGAKFASLVVDAGAYLAQQFMGLVTTIGGISARGYVRTRDVQNSIFRQVGNGPMTGAVGEKLETLHNITENLPVMMQMLGPLLTNVVGPELQKAIASIGSTLARYAPGIFKAIFDSINPILQQFIDTGVSDLMTAVMDSAPVVIEGLLQTAIGKAPVLVSKLITEFATQLIGHIPDIVKALAAGLAKGVYEAIKGLIPGFSGDQGFAGGWLGGTSDNPLPGNNINPVNWFFSQGGTVPEMQYFATGGLADMYRGAARSFARGSDTVPAMLTPGEEVLDRQTASAVRSGRATLGSAPVTVNFHGTGTGEQALQALIARMFVAEVQRQGGKARTALDVSTNSDPFVNFPPPALLQGA